MFKKNFDTEFFWNTILFFFVCLFEGLVIISNAFTNDGAMSWIKKCVQQFSESPYRTNLSNLGVNLKENSWWSSIKGSLSRLVIFL